MTYRILVTGSRDWDDYAQLSWEIGRAYGEATSHPVTIVHGACPTGADKMADRIARTTTELTPEPHPAHWDKHGRAAGIRRNIDMVKLGADICLAFIRNQSPGATHCANLAEQAGIPVRRFT